MQNCELCGKEFQLVHASIEGTEMDVCRGCASFGQIIRQPKPVQHAVRHKETQLPPELNELSDAVVSNVAQLVRQAREKRSLKQEDFAKMLNEKESIIHKIEAGLLEPPIPLARKLGKLLGIKLIEQVKEAQVEQQSRKGDAVTIGDIIKVK